MTIALTAQDLAKLDGAHPDLARVVFRAAELYRGRGFRVAEVVRTPHAAALNALAGTGIAKSLHIRQPDGYSHAVDLHPTPIDWSNLPAFRAIAVAMFTAADERNVLIQWGADWDTDGAVGERGEWDHPHFQLAQPHRIADARAARIRRFSARANGTEDIV